MRITSVLPAAVAALLLAVPAALQAQAAPADSLRGLATEEVETLPQLRNWPQVARSIQRHYPEAMRGGGQLGHAVVRFQIDERGTPRGAYVHQSSAMADLDQASLRVVADMRFSPARRGGRAVAVWVTLPVSFNGNAPPPVSLKPQA